MCGKQTHGRFPDLPHRSLAAIFCHQEWEEVYPASLEGRVPSWEGRQLDDLTKGAYLLYE
jgi:hypothetical protein